MSSKNKKQILHFFKNIITSGKHTEKSEFGMSDYFFRYKLMNSIIIFGFFIFAFFSVWSLAYKALVQAAICISMLLIFLAAFVLARANVRQIIPALICMVSHGIFCFTFQLFEFAGDWIFLHMYSYPLMAIMLLGIRLGVVLSLILFCFIVQLKFIYVDPSLIQMSASYFITIIIMIVIETNRKKKDRIIESQAGELKDFNDSLQIMVDEKTKNVLDLQNSLLKTMAELVEYRDDITGGHIERTQRGLNIFLEEIERCNLYYEETKDWNQDILLQSCQLHDVGKISISDNILKKPGKLTSQEFEDMKKHANIGKQIIEKIEAHTKESDFLKYAKIFAVSHHEKWDGSGYPNGLKEGQIPLLGRIMAIVDVYDALTSVRPYKQAFTHEDAMRIITENSGSQFDPALVKIFIKKAEEFKRQELLNKAF
jgi:response regulator RpfG family c-di-GMP phosphodiesterase